MSQKTKSPSRHRRLVFTGFSMGVADLIPGVSSGTIAFLYGVYDELLYTIRQLTGAVPRLIFRGQPKKALQLVPWTFMLPLGVGMILAVFSTVQLVSYLLEVHAIYIWSVFFGLVLGSAAVIRKRMHGWTGRRILLMGLGFWLVFYIVGLPVINTADAAWMTLVTGAVASVAMILPGISGTLVMVLLGQYERIIEAISSFEVMTLGVFIVGVVIGLALFARLLSWLLHNHHSAVVAVLIGAMLGSLRAVWPWQDEATRNLAPEINLSFWLAVGLILIGFELVLWLEKIGVARDHIDIDSKEFRREVLTQKD